MKPIRLMDDYVKSNIHMRRTDFRDLLVWQKSRLLCLELYRLTNSFPKREQFSMVDQIRRAALSVPTNIAEGMEGVQMRTLRDFCT